MARPSFRVYLTTHDDGRVTGLLVPAIGEHDELPAGYGDDEAQVLSQLQQTQSGGVNLGASNTIGKIDDAGAGDKVGGEKVSGDQTSMP